MGDLRSRCWAHLRPIVYPRGNSVSRARAKLSRCQRLDLVRGVKCANIIPPPTPSIPILPGWAFKGPLLREDGWIEIPQGLSPTLPWPFRPVPVAGRNVPRIIFPGPSPASAPGITLPRPIPHPRFQSDQGAIGAPLDCQAYPRPPGRLETHPAEGSCASSLYLLRGRAESARSAMLP